METNAQVVITCTVDEYHTITHALRRHLDELVSVVRQGLATDERSHLEYVRREAYVKELLAMLETHA